MNYQFQSIGPTLQTVTLVFLFVAVLAFGAAVFFVAALPGKIARKRAHPQASAVNACGWFGLPTGILWVVAIVWAYFGHDESHSKSVANDKMLREQIAGLEAAVAKLESQISGANR